MGKIVLSKESLMHEIGNAAFVEADLREGIKGSHTLHSTYDICTDHNSDRIGRLLRYAYAEACLGLKGIGRDVSGMGRKGAFCFLTVAEGETAEMLHSGLREFLVASALWAWLRSTLPEAAGVWKERREEAAAVLMQCRGRMRICCRKTGPI